MQKHRLEGSQIDISICLDDLKSSKKIKKASNGKLYINLTLRARKEPDNFGNDCSIYATPTKEEREAAKAKNENLVYHFVGNAKVREFTQNTEQMATASDADLEDFEKDIPF